MTLDALAAGNDAHLEQPLTYTIEEVRPMSPGTVSNPLQHQAVSPYPASTESSCSSSIHVSSWIHSGR